MAQTPTLAVKKNGKGVGHLRCPRSAGKGKIMSKTAENHERPAQGGIDLQQHVGECILAKKFKEYVIPQDVYSVDEVARLLHISPDRVRSFAKRDNDPLPIRHFKGGARGSLVLRDELIDWLVKNTVSAVEEARNRRHEKYVSE